MIGEKKSSLFYLFNIQSQLWHSWAHPRQNSSQVPIFHPIQVQRKASLALNQM
jgi:hypothetical protein